MLRFVISVKDKTTGRDVISPFVISSLDGIGEYIDRIVSFNCLVIIDSIKEEAAFCDLPRKFELSIPTNHEQE